MAKALNLGGYTGMKAELVATLQQMVSPVDKLRNELAHRPGGAFGLHEQILSASSNLATAATNNHAETFAIADHVLFAPADHPVLTSSNIAVLALIEGLVAGVTARNKEAVKLATELTESVMSYLHIPSSNKSPKSDGSWATAVTQRPTATADPHPG